MTQETEYDKSATFGQQMLALQLEEILALVVKNKTRALTPEEQRIWERIQGVKELAARVLT